MSCRDMLDWIRPLLSGISKRDWSAFAIAIDGERAVTARVHFNSPRKYRIIHAQWTQEQVASVRELVPSTDDMLVICLNDCVSQMFTLLDAVASWLRFVDVSDAGARTMCELATMAATNARQARV